MAAALRSHTSRETASLTLSHFRYFFINRLHARTTTTQSNNRSKSEKFPNNRQNSIKGYATNCAQKLRFSILSSQGDPPDIWQPPGDGVSVRVNGSSVNLGRVGSGGSSSGGGNGIESNSKEDCWGGSNLGTNFPTPKEM